MLRRDRYRYRKYRYRTDTVVSVSAVWYRYRLFGIGIGCLVSVSVSAVWYRYRSVIISFLIIASKSITEAFLKKNLIRCMLKLFQLSQQQKQIKTRKHTMCSCYSLKKRFRTGYLSFSYSKQHRFALIAYLVYLTTLN